MHDNNGQKFDDYRSEISQIDKSNLSLRNKYICLKQILERSCKDITHDESLQFPSLFSRLVFISQKYNLSKKLEWHLQNIRAKALFLIRDERHLVSPSQYSAALSVLDAFWASVFIGKPEPAWSTENGDDGQITPFFDKLRVQLLAVDTEACLLHCASEQMPSQTLRVCYNIPSVNDAFNDTIGRLWTGAQLNLIDVKQDKEGYYIPKLFVLEPDYLIDASAIAECFQSYSTSYLHYFRRKFKPAVNTPYILLGNLANFFLDELIYSPDVDDISFDKVFMKSFRTMPFEYASCKDIQSNDGFRQFMDKARQQFDNIKRVVSTDLPANGFSTKDCILEPSFFSEKYGFQGRLDLLQPASSDNLYRIIELKSGKTPFPSADTSKIASNHEAQTVVYRLMVQSAFGLDARSVYPAILYSSATGSGQNVRSVAAYQQLEKEIIDTRNQIVATEHDLYTGDIATVSALVEKLFDTESYGSTPDFFTEKLNDFHKIFSIATDIEKKYLLRFVNFISRELYLQKTGDEAYDSSMSTSALWNKEFNERRESLDLISDLKIDNIDNIDDADRGMTIRFSRPVSEEFVNFREGEICIVYPRQCESDTVLSNQILKGTLIEISAEHVLVRFRYKQRNRHFFDNNTYWAIEHDRLDNTYNAMLRDLFGFLKASQSKRDLLLGLCPPRSSSVSIGKTDNLSIEQKQAEVIEKALSAEDYFLIVGPPGTGKTSIFARRLIERLYSNPEQNILVMAYTNRAVDELCAAIAASFGNDDHDCNKYIRIGSEQSCGVQYRHRLLQNISEAADTRKHLLQTLASTRIFVGTLAAINGKPELFDLKNFDMAIIDEASQILEPQIIGLLPRFRRFIMIGDHKQLSTITLQNESKSKVTDPDLNSIGLFDCRESLFERLFGICMQNGWNTAYDTLTYHGRMHDNIADLVNQPFYEGLLRTATGRQTAPLGFVDIADTDKYQSLVGHSRVGFIPVRCDTTDSPSDKINVAEADKVAALAKAIYEIYSTNKTFDAHKTLGIIAPYRNQIALIKHKLQSAGIPYASDIMVDTVERFQGSQRDVIIISFCFNKPYQISFFSNMNREKLVDRKLNVALTRAREQLFIVGNDLILRHHPLYNSLLNKLNFK